MIYLTRKTTARVIVNCLLPSKRLEVIRMDIYEVLMLLATFGLFIVALLAYLDTHKK